MTTTARADREQQLLRMLRSSPTRLQAEYRRVLGISADVALPNGMPGASLIMGILDCEHPIGEDLGDASPLKPLAK